MQEAVFGGNAIIADDRAAIRDLVRSALGHTWCVFSASNGLQAVEYARFLRAELVILDINMEPLNGIDAASQIRALPGYAGVPLVILTGFDTPEHRRKAQRAGVNSVVTKPFSQRQLQSAIRPLLTASLSAATAHAQPDAPNVLAVHRQVDSISSRQLYDREAGWPDSPPDELRW